MPIVLIHGIGVREDGWKRIAQRCEPILRRYLLEPLGLDSMETRWAYWGQYGASFAWDLTSLPRMGVLESLGATQPTAEQESLAAMLADWAELSETDTASTESLLLRAAQRDLPALANQLVAQAILREDIATESLIAFYEAACQPAVRQAVRNAQSPDELRQTLADALAARLPSPLETMGALGGSRIVDDLLNVVLRLTDPPVRLTRAILQKFLRPALTELAAQLMGDVMAYLAHRGERKTPGAIVQAVQSALAAAPNEPLLVLTHSMGGNIFYDLITYYCPKVRVDAWVSAAGQVGLLEELKLFKASDSAVRSPKRVAVSPSIGYWLNVYDPVDVLGFAAAPIFEGVDDLPYKTGSGWGAHALENYFGAPRFYETIAPKLEASLRR